MKRATVLAVCCALLMAGCGAQRSFQRANQYANAQDWDQAVIYYQKALLEDPGNIEYRKALDLARVKASQRHLELAKAWRQAGVLERAEAEYRLALELDPTNQFAADSLTQVLEEKQSRVEGARPTGQTDLERMKQEVGISGLPLLRPGSNEPITLNFPPNTKIRDIYLALAKAAGINVLFDSGITDRDTFSIDIAGVSFEKALDQVALANRHFYKVIDEKTIFLAPDTPQKRRDYEDQVIQTFYLSNASPSDMVNIIRGVVEARRLVPNASLNAITVRDTPGKLAVIERIVRANDKPPAEVVIDVDILEVASGTNLDYGVGLSSYGVTQGVDQPDTIQGGSGELRGLRLSSIPYVNQSDWLITIPDIIYRLEKGKGNIRTLAQPSLRALDGKQVTLRLGDQVPIETSTFVNTGGVTGNVARNFQFRDIGTNIDITPRVHHNNEVTLQLQVEVTSQGNDPDGPAGPVPPTFGNRRVNTEIRLKDGETNLLAGLFQSSENTSRSGLPGVIDLPVLGAIFGSNSSERRETDIILTLTPHIVRTPNIGREDLEGFYVGTENNVGVNVGIVGISSLEGQRSTDDVELPEESPAGALPEASPQATPPPPDTQGSAAGADSGAAAGGEQAETAGAPAEPLVVAWEPGSITVPVGQEFAMDVVIQDARDVAHAPFRVNYDPELLEVLEVTRGDFMESDEVPVQFMTSTLAGGQVMVGLSRVGRRPGVSGSGRLLRLRMRALAPGNAALTFSNQRVADSRHVQLSATFVPATVTVVP